MQDVIDMGLKFAICSRSPGFSINTIFAIFRRCRICLASQDLLVNSVTLVTNSSSKFCSILFVIPSSPGAHVVLSFCRAAQTSASSIVLSN